MPATVTEHKKCICVEFGDTNNNKFWEYTLYSDGSATSNWGRVGQNPTPRPTTPAKAYKKWGEKTNQNNKPDKRYTEIKAVDTGGSVSVSGSSVKSAALKDIARKQIKSKNPLTQDLVDYCAAVNIHTIMKQSGGQITFDASSAQFKTPLGVIAPDQVSDARDLLVKISDFVSANDFTNRDFNSTLNSYLRLIPHDVGMTKITPKLVFPNTQSILAENDLLDGLDTSFIDVTTKPKKKTSKKKDSTPQVFNVELELVEDKKLISYVRNLYQKTRKSMHQSNSLSVHAVYTVKIANMANAFDKYGAKLPDIRQLWHGTKASNLLSILKGGLIIPSSSSGHVTGRMYGDGVYASSVSTKALNYATNFWGSGGSTDRTFMFLLDMAMGKYYDADTWGGNFPRRGTDSTWARAGRALKNDEMIVYRLDQVNLTHLVEFRQRR
jgi:poly [ADP-ribose] polymerase 2/3/4